MLVDVGQGRVLQVFDGADGGLRAVRMVREQRQVHLLVSGAAVVGHVHVLLFINSLQLGVEQTENGVSETLALNHQPTL